MANNEHRDILRQGVFVWNDWRQENPLVKPDLSGIELIEKDLHYANLRQADISNANLRHSDLTQADLVESNLTDTFLGWSNALMANFSKANLFGANLPQAHLQQANFEQANLSAVNLYRADLFAARLKQAILVGSNLQLTELSDANFSGADLRNADLMGARMVETNFENANLTNSLIFGVSAWHLKLDGANQVDLVITPPDEPTITVDDLEVAQFLYLILRNERVRSVINTISTKVVLILGRFTPKRKVILDAIRKELRKHNYVPVLFDFDKPATRDLTETVKTIAHISRFIIADITEPRSIPQELQAIVPDLAVPVIPLLESSEQEYAMFVDLFKKYHWVLPIYKYDDLNDLVVSLPDKVIAPAEAKARELDKR